MKLLLFLVLLWLSLLCSQHTYAANENSTKENIQIPGRLMLAYSIAYTEFAKNKFELKNYVINIKELDKYVKISFIPIPKSYETGIRGGRNSSGVELHYAVSLPDQIILRTWYGR